MTIQLSPQSKKELTRVREYGYDSPKTFVEDAIRHRIFALRKEGYLAKTKKIREVMKRRGVSEKKITKDFEEARHS